MTYRSYVTYEQPAAAFCHFPVTPCHRTDTLRRYCPRAFTSVANLTWIVNLEIGTTRPLFTRPRFRRRLTGFLSDCGFQARQGQFCQDAICRHPATQSASYAGCVRSSPSGEPDKRTYELPSFERPLFCVMFTLQTCRCQVMPKPPLRTGDAAGTARAGSRQLPGRDGDTTLTSVGLAKGRRVSPAVGVDGKTHTLARRLRTAS